MSKTKKKQKTEKQTQNKKLSSLLTLNILIELQRQLKLMVIQRIIKMIIIVIFVSIIAWFKGKAIKAGEKKTKQNLREQNKKGWNWTKFVDYLMTRRKFIWEIRFINWSLWTLNLTSSLEMKLMKVFIWIQNWSWKIMGMFDRSDERQNFCFL